MTKKSTVFLSARKALGLTQQDVAKRTGIAQSVISDLESGTHTNPTWDVLSKLSQLYRRRPEELLPPVPLPGERHKHNTRPVPSRREHAQVSL